MDRLWSPWRMDYVSRADEATGCIFCAALDGKEDELTHVLHRGDDAFVLLNAFPYNTGHLMVAPTRHVGDLKELEPGGRATLMELVTVATGVIQETMRPEGFNVGINLGKAAGAGVPGHLHVHVVPRWGGDTNYMTVTGNTKVLPEMLAETAAKLAPGFQRL